MMAEKAELVKIKVGTLCTPGQVCLLSRYSLVLTCVARLEIEKEQLCSFCARGDWDPSSCLAGKPPGFPSRYASQVLPIFSQYLN